MPLFSFVTLFFLLSAYLFYLALETLPNKIRSNINIIGINIDNKEIKISILADEINLDLI